MVHDSSLVQILVRLRFYLHDRLLNIVVNRVKPVGAPERCLLIALILKVEILVRWYDCNVPEARVN